MIPYFPEPILHAGPVTVTAFSFMGAAAIAVSGWTVLQRGCGKGFAADPMFHMWLWMLTGAMLGAIAPDAMRGHFGFSSPGAICGGTLGGLLWSFYQRLSLFEIFRRMEVIAYTMPLTAMIGRFGCAMAHDHRGIASTSWIAVRFPEGPRFDLGFLEFLFLAVLAFLFRVLDRRPRPEGFFLVWAAASYSICRLWLDTLRPDPNYLDVVVAAGMALIAGLASYWFRATATGIRASSQSAAPTPRN